jgi:hypothetical protein
MVKVVLTLTVHLFYLLVLGAVIRVMLGYNDVRRLPVLTILTHGARLGCRLIPDVVLSFVLLFFHRDLELPSW